MKKVQQSFLVLSLLLCFGADVYADVSSKTATTSEEIKKMLVDASLNNNFVHQGQAINPVCVAMLATSDFGGETEESGLGSSFQEIKVSDCQNNYTQQSYGYSIDENGYKISYTRYKDEYGDERGYFQYNLIGTSADNVVILKTLDNEGGSGLFSSLLLIKIVGNGSDARLIKIKTINGGDRCYGGFASIKIEKNLLKIDQYVDAECAACCSHTRQIAIDLKNIEN